MINLPRILIAAPASGSGKSVVAMGIMAELSKTRHVQGFKVGPDYIDPMYHSIATGRSSRNLDSWMLPPNTVQQIFTRNAQTASISIIEGVMGLFDGFGSDPFSGSSASVAALLQCPVILVMDCSKLSGSAAAIVHGMDTFSDTIHIAGVICNRVGSDNHAQWLQEVIETHTSVPVLGCIPRLDDLQIPQRHLGLFTVAESPDAAKIFTQQAGEIIRRYVNLEQLEQIAGSASPLNVPLKKQRPELSPVVRLAVARDEAFCFYYEENLDALRQYGAEIIPFSPLKDKTLPENIDGIYLGGGYPELYAGQLSRNKPMLGAIQKCCRQNMPVYAECGGLMYLTEGLKDQDQMYTLVNAIPGYCHMGVKLQMGYREVTTRQHSLLCSEGEKLRGHEFHYSNWNLPDTKNIAYEITPRNNSDNTRPEGYANQNLLASYIHLHFLQNEKLAYNFVQRCMQWKNNLSITGVSFNE